MPQLYLETCGSRNRILLEDVRYWLASQLRPEPSEREPYDHEQHTNQTHWNSSTLDTDSPMAIISPYLRRPVPILHFVIPSQSQNQNP